MFLSCQAISLRPDDARFINSIGILADVTGDADGAYRSVRFQLKRPAALAHSCHKFIFVLMDASR